MIIEFTDSFGRCQSGEIESRRWPSLQKWLHLNRSHRTLHWSFVQLPQHIQIHRRTCNIQFNTLQSISINFQISLKTLIIIDYLIISFDVFNCDAFCVQISLNYAQTLILCLSFVSKFVLFSSLQENKLCHRLRAYFIRCVLL